MKKTSIIGIIIAVVGLILWGLDLFMDLFPFCSWAGCILFMAGSWLAMKGENAEEADKGLLKLMMSVAAQDGKLDIEETKIVAATAQRIGISQKEVEKIVEEFSKGEVKFTIPESDKTKKEHIRELVKIMKADGDIDDKELKIVKQVAEQYGLGRNYVDQFI